MEIQYYLVKNQNHNVCIDYVYEHCGAECVYILEIENPDWTCERVHDIPYYSGSGNTFRIHHDFGFCGISNLYFPEIVNDKRFLSDCYWQLDQCIRLIKNGTRFYGADRMDEARLRFHWEISYKIKLRY